jgi:hypothetical protein
MQQDINNKVEAEFSRWLITSVDLYRTADLPFEASTEHITSLMLTGALSALMANMKGPKNKKLKKIHAAIDTAFEIACKRADKEL